MDGAVSPETSGTVTITARSADREEVLDSVTLTVYTIPMESISITGRPEDDCLPAGESVQLAVTILPENVTDGVNFWQRNTQWSSSDPSVASVDSNGLVTAHSLGTAVITAEVLYYGVSGSFTLTVPRVPVTNIYLANSNGQESITEGSSLYICPVVRPENATNQTLLWVSDNPTVATASATNCTIYAHAPGNATITLMAESDPTVTAEIEVTVFPMTVELNRPSGDTLIKGQSWQLATNPNVRMESENSEIVTVGENGWITANKTGRVILEVWWAHDPGGFMRYELVVSTGLTIIGRPENDTLYTQVTYTDIGAAYSADQYYEVLWDSSDPSVAEIEYNFVRGITTITTHSPGTTYISALIPELNAYDIFELTVSQCQLDNILFDPDSSLEDNQLYVGEKGELSAEIFPAAFADQPLQWTSTEPEILQVMPITYTRAKVVAKAPGYAIVSVKHNGIPYNNFEVTVKSPTIQIVNLPSANRLKVGQTHTLTAMTDPAGMTVTWKSGNTNVATVNSAGKITAKAAGTATISATVVRGGKSYTASFTLRVEQPVTGVWINCPLQNYSMNVGETCTLTAEVDPPNAANRSVIWSSSDTSVATVTSAGKLTALKAGTTVIKATSAANSSLWDHFTLTINRHSDPFHSTNIEYIRVKKYCFTWGSDTINSQTVVSKSALDDFEYITIFDGNMNISDLNVTFKVDKALKDYLYSYYNNYVQHPTLLPGDPGLSFYMARMLVDDMVENGYIASESTEYYGIWANETIGLLYDMLHITNLVQLSYAVTSLSFSIFHIVAGIKSSQAAINTTQTFYNSNYRETAYLADDLLDSMTNNPNSNTVMLGTTAGGVSYHQVAYQQGRSYFYSSNYDSYVSQYGPDAMLATNRAFIYNAKNAGKTFWFSHDPISQLANPDFVNSTYTYELRYLEQLYGITISSSNIVKSGTVWFLNP